MNEETEITCREIVGLVTDYLEGAMAQDVRARMDRHLATCDGCINYLKQMRETIRVTGQLTEEQIPETQRRQLLEAFRDWRRSG